MDRFRLRNQTRASSRTQAHIKHGKLRHVDAPSADVVILTALSEEHNAVVRALGDVTQHQWHGYAVARAITGNTAVIALPMNSMGNVGAAHAATLAIGTWNPAAILLVGIAGGVRASAAELKLGDLLVPELIVGYELAKQRDSGLERRFQVVKPTWELVQVARGLDLGDWAPHIAANRPEGDASATPSVFFDPVLTGEKVIADDQTIPELRKSWPKAVGVEMEALGAGLAADRYRGGPSFLMVKSVCDFADPSKNDKWHSYAAEAAAQFAISVIRKWNYGSRDYRPQAEPQSGPKEFTAAQKLYFVRNLHNSWQDLADMYDLSPYERGRFPNGEEARSIWAWLEVRNKLWSLPGMLREISRGDIADQLEPL